MAHIALWFAALSLLCYVLMFLDKRAAIRNGWRVQERTLLFWAFLGGGVGGKLAQGRFRHKTRKEPFRTLLNLALATNAVLAVLLLMPSLRQGLFDTLLSFL